jgi:hypothetical protein
MTDPLDNLNLPDKSKFRRNPYYADIMSGKLKFDFDLLEHDPDELAAFERYRNSNQPKAV